MAAELGPKFINIIIFDSTAQQRSLVLPLAFLSTRYYTVPSFAAGL